MVPIKTCRPEVPMIEVVSIANAVLMKVLPSRMVMNNRRGLSKKRTIAKLLFLLSSLSLSSCALFKAHKAVSEPEKKAENRRKIATTTTPRYSMTLMMEVTSKKKNMKKVSLQLHSVMPNTLSNRRLPTTHQNQVKKNSLRLHQPSPRLPPSHRLILQLTLRTSSTQP